MILLSSPLSDASGKAQKRLARLLLAALALLCLGGIALGERAHAQVDSDSSASPTSSPPLMRNRPADASSESAGASSTRAYQYDPGGEIEERRQEDVSFDRIQETRNEEESQQPQAGQLEAVSRSPNAPPSQPRRRDTRPARGPSDSTRERPEERGPRIEVNREALPEGARQEISSLNVKGADLRNVLRGLGEQYSLNLVVDDAISERVTVRLTGLPVIDALVFLAREHGLSLLQRSTIFRFKQPATPTSPEPTRKPPAVRVSEGRLSADLSEDPLRSTLRAISQQSKKSMVVQKGLEGTLSGYLEAAPFEKGLSALLSNNGFRLRKRDGVYAVTRGRSAREEGRRRQSLWTDVSQGSIDVDVTEAPIGDVLRDIAQQVEVNIVSYGVPEGQITAKVEGLTVEQALNMLLKGSDLTYRRENDIYFIGGKETSGITSSKLISLEHIKAESVLKKIPGRLKKAATVQAVPEHNGLLVTGTSGAISEMEQFVSEVDHPTPLILIEALVVDFQTTDLFELGFEMGRDGERAAAAADESYEFDEDGYELQGDGGRINDYVENFIPLLGSLGIQKIGELPDDFYFKLRALSQEGKADIRSRPQIATLNGHEANLSIGTTQYYILESDVPDNYPDPGRGEVDGRYYRSRERFEKIEANVKLDITPWVSASGEVTTEIRPEFSTPVGNFQPGVPPTINSRVLESTVRLKDGETIVLGGLIQEDRSVSYTKIPILGSIPLLGQLFRTRTHDTKKSELVIYLTPHVFYGDGGDQEKWGALRERLDLRNPEAGSEGSIGFTELGEPAPQVDSEPPEERRRRLIEDVDTESEEVEHKLEPRESRSGTDGE